MEHQKIKLSEVNYRFAEPADVDAFLSGRANHNKLLQFLSQHFEISSFSPAAFNFDEPVAGIHYVAIHQRIGKLTIPFKLHQRIKKQNPQIVLVHGINQFLQVMHLRLCLGRKTKIIVQHHGEQPKGFLKRALLKISARFANAYLFTAVETATALGLPKHKVHALMEGSSDMAAINKPAARSQLGIASDETVYLWVGRLIPIKNPLFFLNAFNAFSSAKKNTKLYLIYEDDQLLKACQALCRQNPNIIFIGKVDYALMNDWYSAADFFVSASVYEGSGYALCEAMQCRLIPIVSNINAFNFMTSNGSCAITFESNNASTLNNALEKSLLIDKEEIKEKVTQQFNSTLSYQAIADNFYRITSLL